MYCVVIMKTNKEFVLTLLSAAAKVERRLDRALSLRRGVSFTEYNMLSQLQTKFNGAATRVDLAQAVNLTPSAITRALKPLEKIGFVVTEKSDRDARRSLAKLTAAGEELLSDANAIVQDEIALLEIQADNRDALLSFLKSI